MQRRQTVPSSRQQNANQSPLPPVDSSRPSLLSQLLSLLTRVLLTILAYPLSYLPKPKGLNADTSTSDALATKESLNIPSNLGVSYPQALKHCCPDLVEGEMPEFRLLILVIHSPLHPLSRSLISSLESATPESVSSNEMNLLIVSTSTAEGRLLSQKYSSNSYPWTGVISPLDLTSSSSLIRTWSSTTSIRTLYNQGILLGRLKSAPNVSAIDRLCKNVSEQWGRQMQEFTSRRYAEFARRVERRNQDLEFERVRTEDRLRLEARLASERARLLEEEKRENDLKSKIENEAILREEKRSRVPESGGSVRLKFVLPKGQSFTYSFTPETDVSIIRDTIDVKIEDEDWGIRNYELVSRSERKKIGEGKIGEWCQGGVIMIADLDA
ncbi:hypothetical protein TrST_g2159 [Triparma strigata]|uniref:UBX domain-containing protein n=1 Tax=Triparma strigata TaxID=1606541 RepID=A0A9W7BII8_9STRA|nr:hypothetical protein TrST_g2159 [Triparma strigata]